MNSDTLHKLIYKGAKKLQENPCEQCKIPFNGNEYTKAKRLHFHGSDVGKCKRSIYYDLHRRSKTIESGLNSLFLFAGHLFEALIVRCLELAGEEIHTVSSNNGDDDLEVRISQETMIDRLTIEVQIIGHYDLIINNEILVEIKSVKTNSFNSVFLKQDLSQRPQYYGQVQTYLHALPHIKKAYLVGIHRESCEIAPPIEIKRDRVYMERVFQDYAKLLYYGIVKDQLPPRGHDNKNDYECRFCDHKSYCWSSPQGSKASEVDFEV